jgi:hypothetical protein
MAVVQGWMTQALCTASQAGTSRWVDKSLGSYTKWLSMENDLQSISFLRTLEDSPNDNESNLKRLE